MRYVRIGTQYEAGLQELATAFLKFQVREATWKVISPEHREAAIAFVKGSGLETIIEICDLPLEPVHFRNVFQQCLTPKSLWSSATIGIVISS